MYMKQCETQTSNEFENIVETAKNIIKWFKANRMKANADFIYHLTVNDRKT